MDQRRIPLVTNTAEGDISGSETLINVFPEKSTGGKYSFTLKGTPGLAFFIELPTFPVKALHTFNDKIYAITPSTVYEINSGSYVVVGRVKFTGRVNVENNGIQMVMVDGINGYFYDKNTNTITQLLPSQGFYPARTVAYQDGYFLFERKGTGLFFTSDLLAITLDPLNTGSVEGQPDDVVGLISDHREVFIFGNETIEVFYNSGDADFPFDRNQGAFIEKGCAAPYSIGKQDNTIYFVGSDLMVYQINGYTPVRISTHAVEQDLLAVDLSDCFAYTYHEKGHLFYQLTIPANKITWCYDISTRAWHIRKDIHFGRHRSECKVFANKKNLVGDFQSGRIYEMTQQYFNDDVDPIVRSFTLPTLNSGRDFLTINSVELDMTTGLLSGADLIASLTFSKDGGLTWSNKKFANLGALGQYLTRVKWNRLGCARQFVITISISAPIAIDIGGAWIEIG